MQKFASSYFQLSLTLLLYITCISCNKSEPDVKQASSTSQPWNWRTPQSKPLSLTGEVTTFAGFPGDIGSTDGFGMYATFDVPYGVTTDGVFLYVAESNLIRKINIATSEVTTIAGQAGVSGNNDGVGTLARFDNLWMITTDGLFLYMTEGGKNTIRKMNLITSEVKTIAGSPGQVGSANGIGSTARFNSPSGITTDGTNLYISDSGNYTIRRLEISTNAVTTIAGKVGIPGSLNGVGANARFGYPFALTTDGTSIFVADMDSQAIRKIDITTNMVSTLAGDSSSPAGHVDATGRFAHFNDPLGITNDGTYLYVTENSGCTIRKINIATGKVITLAGQYLNCTNADGQGSAAFFNSPYSITTDGTSLYSVEMQSVRRIK